MILLHPNRFIRYFICSATVVVLLSFLYQTGSAQEKAPTDQPVAAAATLTKEIVTEKLAATRKTLAAISASAGKDSPEGLIRTALQRQIELLEQELGLIAKAEAQTAQKAAVEDRLKRAGDQLTALSAESPPQPPAATDKKGFESFNDNVDQQRDRVAAMRTAIAEHGRRLEALPELMAETRKESEAAEKNASLLAESSKSAKTDTEKKLIDLRLENARLEKQMALKSIKILTEEADLAADLEPVLNAELELAEKQLERLEQELELYSKAYEQQLALAQQQKVDSLARKEKEAATAKTPAARFIAEWEAELSRSEKNKGDLEQFIVGLERDAADQDKRLATEKEELAGFRELLKQAGASRRAADRIKLTLRQLRLRRRVLSRPFRQGFSQTINGYRDRRFAIEDTLFSIRDRWKEGVEAAMAQLSEGEQAAFKAAAGALLNRYRAALQDEKGLLTEAIRLGQQIQITLLARMDTLNALERFIRSRVFWLRDDKPVGAEVLTPIGSEIRNLALWSQKIVSAEMTAWLTDNLRSPVAIFYGLILFIALPAGLFYARQRLRRVTRSRLQLTVDRGVGALDRVFVIFGALMSAALLPAYLLILARFIGTTDLPLFLRPVLSRTLAFAAYFLFFWFLTRSILRQRGIARLQFDMPPDAAHTLYRSLRIILIGYVTWLLFWQILRVSPFDFQALPRICYTLFELMAAMAIVWLVRPRSPFVQRIYITETEGFIARYGSSLSTLLILIAIFIVVLDIAGYRYGAQRLARSYTLSLVTLMLLPLLYTAVLSMLKALARRRGMLTPAAAPGEAAAAEAKVEVQIQRFARIVFILVAVILLANYWGIDTQAFKTLDELNLYRIRGTGDVVEFVTVGDLIRAALFLVATFWILRALPGIYEFTLFPRLRLDEGMKYATLTMSRYGIFVVGMLLTLSEMHLDLGRLGWLMAAVGVGLGFGLQEIVSNFVSGIILLVERPVQVGDTVTVGNMSGKVRRINIRATTILNFDRQEVILPNRSLITREVTNWTRGDTINRLVISIGVAYGSDIEKVSEILVQIAREDPDVMKEPAPSVVFMQHGDSSLDFNLRVFIPSPEFIMVLRDRLNKRINREFEKHGIEIPFPQRDLHIRSSVVRTHDLMADKGSTETADRQTSAKSD
jgi:small-conductance mechanosensitive channel